MELVPWACQFVAAWLLVVILLSMLVGRSSSALDVTVLEERSVDSALLVGSRDIAATSVQDLDLAPRWLRLTGPAARHVFAELYWSGRLLRPVGQMSLVLDRARAKDVDLGLLVNMFHHFGPH